MVMIDSAQKRLLFDAVKASLTRARGDVYLSLRAIEDLRYSEEFPFYVLFDELRGTLSQIERAMHYLPDSEDLS
jgi:hypothetical protein